MQQAHGIDWQTDLAVVSAEAEDARQRAVAASSANAPQSDGFGVGSGQAAGAGVARQLFPAIEDSSPGSPGSGQTRQGIRALTVPRLRSASGFVSRLRDASGNLAANASGNCAIEKHQK